MGSRKRPSAALGKFSVQEALRQYAQRAPTPFAITRGAAHIVVYANSAFRQLAALPEGEALETPIADVFTGTEGRAITSILDRAFQDSVELLNENIDGSRTPESSWQCSAWPITAPDGRATGLGIEMKVGKQLDPELAFQRGVAEQMLLGALRERGFAEDAEAARGRATFLADAGHRFAESVGETSTLTALTKLVLPSLGAWCIVDILEEEGEIKRLAIHHPDPDKQKLAHTLQATWLPKPGDPFGAAAVLRDERTIAMSEDLEATLSATAGSDENREILRQLGIGSLLTVPLVARKKLLGAITYISDQPGFWNSIENVQLAESLAARGALALDNAQMYELAQVLRAKAETANQAKTAFLGSMSHELRTPLNAIGGYIELLDMGLRGPVTDDQHADFARVRSNQQRLLVLITEILNFVRVGSGQMAYSVDDFDAEDAMQQAIALIEPLFVKKGIVFDGISCSSPVVAHADRERVAQILANILSNAIKFTPAGGHISAECATVNESVNLSVSDSGIGIAPEKYDTIFEPFVQLKQTVGGSENGVGLGLAISRDLARGMNGDLTVESARGKGSRFTLSLPRASLSS